MLAELSHEELGLLEASFVRGAGESKLNWHDHGYTLNKGQVEEVLKGMVGRQ
jgi:hypothetical protein